MIVYHGSISEVRTPLVSLGRKNLDFGQGFYVTDHKKQAISWANRMSRRKLAPAILNIYDLDFESAKLKFRYLRFEAYNKSWLDFIVASRMGRKPWKFYDIVEGGVANDNVIDTVEDYIRGRMSAEAALAELSKHQPNNQICLLSQEAINTHLVFLESSKL